MSIQSMAAAHAAGKGSEPDSVFAVVAKIREAKKLPGAEAIIDGSIGAMRNEDGSLSILPVVDEEYRKLPAEDLMDYAAIAGSPEFIAAAIQYTFQGFQPAGTIAGAVGTPGGTGAVRLMIANYLDDRETALIPDWHWAPYRTIAQESRRRTDTYAMFDEKSAFNTADIKAKVRQTLERQNNMLIIFNTPGHNPTGYSMSQADWAELIPFLRQQATASGKKVIVGLDMAYADYCGDPREARRFLGMFTDLPENMQVVIAFSMSKSFFIYGMRCGAIVGFHPSAAVMRDFANIHSFSARGAWSNGSRGAQEILAKICGDPILSARADQERRALAELLSQRAAIFTDEARAVGLRVLPYYGGFFVTIPVKEPKLTTEKLMASNIYLVPMTGGLRLAVCAVPKNKMPGLATKIRAAQKELEG